MTRMLMKNGNSISVISFSSKGTFNISGTQKFLFCKGTVTFKSSFKRLNDPVLEEHVKNSPFDNRLKQVYVVSHDPEGFQKPASQSPPVNTKDSEEEFNRTRPLPVDRQPFVQSEFGFYEPTVVPRGRCTLRQALKFIYDHQSDPSTYSISSIATEYRLSENNIGNILQYYRTFEVFIPKQDDKSQTKIATPNTGERLESGKSSSKRPG